MNSTKSREQQILDWAHTAFGPRTLTLITNKLFEETGEIAGQVNRLLEGRIGTHDTVLDEMGDALIVMSQMAGFFNTTLEDILTKRWNVVQIRQHHSDLAQHLRDERKMADIRETRAQREKEFEESVKRPDASLANDLSDAKAAVLTEFPYPPIVNPFAPGLYDRKAFDEAVKRNFEVTPHQVSIEQRSIEALLKENERLAKLLGEERNETRRLRNLIYTRGLDALPDTNINLSKCNGMAKLLNLFGPFKVKLANDIDGVDLNVIGRGIHSTDSVPNLKKDDEGVCYGVEGSMIKVEFDYQGVVVLLNWSDVVHVPPQEHLTPAPEVS